MAARTPTSPQPTPRDVVLLSDLHLGSGRERGDGRWSRLEDFFYDRELAALLDALRRNDREHGRGLRVVFNGDVLDFLLVTEVPSPDEARRLGLPVRRAERKFGLRPTEAATIWKLKRIVAGHPEVFDALGRLLAHGAELVWLPGNHDPEIYFTGVQRALRRELVRRARAARPEVDAERAGARVIFRRWFWYEPGRLFVEHGHQYDPTNVLSRLLCPVRPGSRQHVDPEIDLPVGSLFVRYLHNTLKRRNPYIRNFTSLDDYLGFLGSQDLMTSLPQAARNMRFLQRALREAPLWRDAGSRAAARMHRERCEDLAEETELAQPMRRLEALWPVAAGRSKARMVRTMVAPALRQLGIALAVLLVTVYLWALLFNLIQAVEWIAEGPFAKAGWLSLLAVLTFAAVAVIVRSVGRQLKTRSDSTYASTENQAQLVSEIIGVPHVSMGHTHLADARRLRGGARYINTGTWTAIHGPWDRIQPRSLQFTFARLDPDGFRLMRWDHPAGEMVPVDLFEDPPERLLERWLPVIPPGAPPTGQRDGGPGG